MKTITSFACAAIVCLSAASVSAVPILVAEWNGNSGDANELADVAAHIVTYNGANDPDLPLLNTTTLLTVLANKAVNVGVYTPNNSDVIEWTAPAGYDFYYIMTKWGQGSPKENPTGFEHALHYVLAGETLTYNPGGANAPNGLSHVITWGGDVPDQRVPDAGATLALLGVSVTALGFMRRKLVA